MPLPACAAPAGGPAAGQLPALAALLLHVLPPLPPAQPHTGQHCHTAFIAQPSHTIAALLFCFHCPVTPHICSTFILLLVPSQATHVQHCYIVSSAHPLQHCHIACIAQPGHNFAARSFWVCCTAKPHTSQYCHTKTVEHSGVSMLPLKTFTAARSSKCLMCTFIAKVSSRLINQATTIAVQPA